MVAERPDRKARWMRATSTGRQAAAGAKGGGVGETTRRRRIRINWFFIKSIFSPKTKVGWKIIRLAERGKYAKTKRKMRKNEETRKILNQGIFFENTLYKKF